MPDPKPALDSVSIPSVRPVDPETEDPAHGDSGAATSLPKIVKFEALSRCGDEIWIENNGQIYRLRRTKQGKLILTK